MNLICMTLLGEWWSEGASFQNVVGGDEMQSATDSVRGDHQDDCRSDLPDRG